MGSRAIGLVQNELNAARRDLAAKLADIEDVRKLEAEMIVRCSELREKVADLERDQKAIDRGYIALMGDAAADRLAALKE